MTIPMQIRGFQVYKNLLSSERQKQLVDDVRGIISKAPLFSPTTRFGKKMSVGMSSAGEFGWYSDGRGYRYERLHPNGTEWPAIPPSIIEVWEEVSECPKTPQCCLVNFYREGARMGLHQDNDEQDFDAPVVSISLGDEALFRVGGVDKPAPTQSVWLQSGDVVVMGGEARLAYHGIDRIRFGSSGLLKNGGRINLTLRVVT